MQVHEYSAASLRSLLPFPAEDANKYSRGKLTVVGGAASYPGAACMAACSAQRMGAGYVDVICAPECVSYVRMSSPSLVVRAWSADEVDLALRGESKKHPSAWLVGSGFDAHAGHMSFEEQRAFVLSIVEKAQAPVLVDGGALSHMASDQGRVATCERMHQGGTLVVTPHGGEAARMAAPLKLDDTTLNDPAKLAQVLAASYGCTVALKGPDTFVSDGHQVIAVRTGTAALAKAGSGDVLAGMIAALLAQGMNPVDACVLGSTLHGLAGCIAAERYTSICTVPSDVIAAIPEAVRRVAELEESDTTEPS